MEPLVLPYRGKQPRLAEDVFLAPTAVVIGDVTVGPASSLWFGVVVRGDIGPIRIGARVNLQEGVVVHLDEGFPSSSGTTSRSDTVRSCMVPRSVRGHRSAWAQCC